MTVKDSESENNKRVTTGWNLQHLAHLVIILFIILIVVTTLIYLIIHYTDRDPIEASSVIAAYGTVLLSAILAYLYAQMWSIQKKRADIQENQEEILSKQTKIQKDQQELLETEKAALLDFSGCDSEGDDCSIRISNFGDGAVKETIIRTRLRPTNEGDFSGTEKSTTLFRMDNGKTGAKVIGPREHNIRMGCCPKFDVRINEKKVSGSFSKVTTTLSESGVKSLHLEIALVAVDEFGNTFESLLTDEEERIHRNMQFDELNSWKINIGR